MANAARLMSEEAYHEVLPIFADMREGKVSDDNGQAKISTILSAKGCKGDAELVAWWIRTMASDLIWQPENSEIQDRKEANA